MEILFPAFLNKVLQFLRKPDFQRMTHEPSENQAIPSAALDIPGHEIELLVFGLHYQSFLDSCWFAINPWRFNLQRRSGHVAGAKSNMAAMTSRANQQLLCHVIKVYLTPFRLSKQVIRFVQIR